MHKSVRFCQIWLHPISRAFSLNSGFNLDSHTTKGLATGSVMKDSLYGGPDIESLRDRSTPEERTQEEERASLSLAHSSFLSSSSLPLPTKLPLPSFFESIFRRLVGKPNTCDKNKTQCCWVTWYLHSRMA